MLETLKSIGTAIVGFFIDLPENFFGEGLYQSVPKLVAACVWFITFMLYLIGGFRSIWEYVRARDAKNRAELDRLNKEQQESDLKAGLPFFEPTTIDWVKAYKQQARSFTFVIPLGIIVLASMWAWIRFDFTQMGYLKMAIAWAVFLTIVIRPWWLSTVLKTERVLLKRGELSPDKAQFKGLNTLSALKLYFAWGLNEKIVKRRVFIGALKKWEPVVDFLLLRWIKRRLGLAVLMIVFFSAGWFVFMPFAPDHLLDQMDEKETLKPRWGPRYALKPDTGARPRPDTPGDAAAAADKKV